MDEPVLIRPKASLFTKGLLVAMGGALVVAVASFVVVALLPSPNGPLFKDSLRSFITGVGVAGVAFPLCAVGAALKRKFALSPYFEGAFIAGVLNLAGYICAGVALVCIGFGVYDLVVRWLQ